MARDESLRSTLSDRASLRDLAARVASELGWNSGLPGSPDFERHDFSYGFRLRREDRDESVYVKFPRHDFLFDRGRPLFPRSRKDLREATLEYESLTFLESALKDRPIRFVRPRLFLEDLGGVVTSLVQGEGALQRLRSLDSAAASGDSASRKVITGWMSELGRSVRAAHESGASGQAAVRWQENRAKIVRSLEGLAGRGCFGSGQMKRWLDLLHTAPEERRQAPETVSLKGLDVRNLMLDQDGGLVFLDPGAIKPAPREADLARFVLTLRILYWGSPKFPVGKEICPATEEAFLEGYGREQVDREVLAWYMVKEVAKHWRMAHVAVDVKDWPSPFSLLVRRLYIDRQYRRKLDHSIRALTAA